MKPIILSLLLTATTVLAVAQTADNEATGDFRGSNSFSLTIPDADQKLVRNVWKDFARTQFRTNVKYDRKAGEYVAANASIHEISGNPVDLISKMEKLGNRTIFILWVDLKGSYLDPEADPKKAADVIALLDRFSVAIEKEKIRIHLEAEEKTLRKLERNLASLQRANQRYHKEIEIAKARIEKMKKNIEVNEEEQVNAVSQIEEQQKTVEAVRIQLHKN